MGISRRHSRHRAERSRRFWVGLLKLGLVLGGVGATGFYAYEVGVELQRSEITRLHAELDRLSAAEQHQRDDTQRLTEQLDEAQRQANEFKSLYTQMAPSDDIKELSTLVKARLAEGLDPRRLAFVIRQAQMPRNCGEVATKRFLVKTPKYTGTNTWVRFSDTVTISADGLGGQAGTQEWFDPDQPITVKFSPIGGQETKISGTLPLQHSMVVRNAEYRFTISPGARGFVDVSGDRCDYR